MQGSIRSTVNRALSDISVVIVTYRGDTLLDACLSSLSAVCGSEIEVVVVDNSPSAATRELTGRFPNVRYVPSPGNPGFAGGNNRGIRFCSRPYILLLNNDTVVHARQSLETLASFLDDHPRCAVVQGTMTLPKCGGSLGGCGSFLTPFGILYAYGAYVPDAPEFHEARPVFSAIGAFMMLRASAIPEAGGMLFRTHFWSYYEETDFCHRVWLSGSQVWYVPTPPIDHLAGQTSSMFDRSRIMGGYLRNQYFSLSANLGRFSRMRILPLLWCVIVGHAMLHLIRGDAAQFRANMAALRSIRRDRARILAARRQAEKTRKTPDRDIFRFAMRMPPLSYFIKSLRANA